jgi:hypothetical protein
MEEREREETSIIKKCGCGFIHVLEGVIIGLRPF